MQFAGTPSLNAQTPALIAVDVITVSRQIPERKLCSVIQAQAENHPACQRRVRDRIARLSPCLRGENDPLAQRRGVAAGSGVQGLQADGIHAAGVSGGQPDT